MIFGNNKKRLSDLSLPEISARMREFIMDSQIQDGHELATILGCSILSEELQIHEEQESDKRLEQISYLIPLMYSFSHILAEAATEFQRDNVSEEVKSLPSSVWHESKKILEQMSLSVLIGAVSQMVDMGLLTVPKSIRRK